MQIHINLKICYEHWILFKNCLWYYLNKAACYSISPAQSRTFLSQNVSKLDRSHVVMLSSITFETHWVFRTKTTSASGNHHIPTSISKHFTKKNKKHVNIYHNCATPTILHISTQKKKAISSIFAGSLPTTTPGWSLCRWTPSSAPPRTPKGIKFSLQRWRSFVPRERHHLEAVHVLGTVHKRWSWLYEPRTTEKTTFHCGCLIGILIMAENIIPK